MTSQKMFYTTLAPNLQTNCSNDCAADCSASGTVATITTTAQLIAICVLATPTLTSNDPPYSAETTHDLSTSLCFCPLSLSCSLAVALSCSCALSRTHTVQKRRRFIFVSFSFYLFWLFGISLFSSVCGSEREKKRESGRGRKSCICNLHFALHKIV